MILMGAFQIFYDSIFPHNCIAYLNHKLKFAEVKENITDLHQPNSLHLIFRLSLPLVPQNWVIQ